MFLFQVKSASAGSQQQQLNYDFNKVVKPRTIYFNYSVFTPQKGDDDGMWNQKVPPKEYPDRISVAARATVFNSLAKFDKDSDGVIFFTPTIQKQLIADISRAMPATDAEKIKFITDVLKYIDAHPTAKPK